VSLEPEKLEPQDRKVSKVSKVNRGRQEPPTAAQEPQALQEKLEPQVPQAFRVTKVTRDLQGPEPQGPQA
jgi:hypothetical protein